MHKTDEEGILCQSRGVLISTKETSYEEQRRRIIAEQRDKDRINTLEEEVRSIKDILQQILSKVSRPNG